MKITLIAHKYSLKVKMLYITRHCLIFFCIQGLIRVLIYVTLSPKQTLFQWAPFRSEVGRLCLQCGSDNISIWDMKTCPKCQGEILAYSLLSTRESLL